jgi:hypothetical protein
MELGEKQEKRCAKHERDEAGDQWDHTAVAADSKLVVSLIVGKRTRSRLLLWCKMRTIVCDLVHF